MSAAYGYPGKYGRSFFASETFDHNGRMLTNGVINVRRYGLNMDDCVAVFGHHGIVCQQANRLGQCLSNQQSVEWVLMM